MNKYLILLFLGFIVTDSFGQKDKKIEQDLIKYFDKIEYWSNYDIDDEEVYKYDSLSVANDRFSAKLLEYTSKHPETIQQDFSELKEKGLSIVTSEDELFRIYSWDDMSGGEIRYFDTVIQYKLNSNKTTSKLLLKRPDSGETGYFCSDMYTVKNESETYYLATINAIHSNANWYQAIKVFSIDAGILNDSTKLIKTSTGIRNVLGFNFDFFSADDKGGADRLIKYDPLTKVLKFPVVLENGKVTNRFISYEFTGKYFERKN